MSILRLIKSIFLFTFKTLAGAIIIASVFLIFSYFIFYPEPKVEIIEQSGRFEIFSSSPRIIISNLSGQDIYQLEFSFRYDTNLWIDRKPSVGKKEDISEISLIFMEQIDDEFDYKKSLDISKDVRVDLFSILVTTNGFSGKIYKLADGARAEIIVDLTKLNNEKRGVVLFPPMLHSSLRNNSYYFNYKYNPLGIFSSIKISKHKCYELSGRKTKADNYKLYKHTVKVNGKAIEVCLETTKKGKKWQAKYK